RTPTERSAAPGIRGTPVAVEAGGAGEVTCVTRRNPCLPRIGAFGFDRRDHTVIVGQVVGREWGSFRPVPEPITVSSHRRSARALRGAGHRSPAARGVLRSENRAS